MRWETAVHESTMSLKRKIYENNAQKKKDFWIGVGIWFGLNILMGLCVGGVNAMQMSMINSDASNPTLRTINFTLFMLLGILPFVVNIGLIVYFAFTRGQIALGMLAGFGMALALVIFLGIFLSASCFQTPYQAAAPRILVLTVTPLLIIAIILAVIFFMTYRSTRNIYALRMVWILAVIITIALLVSCLFLAAAYLLLK